MIDRISLLLKSKNISASQFADEISVQRSSISHVFSGRNKPSLEFVQKILKRYPEINPDWLLFGKGPMNIEFNLFSDTDESLPVKEDLISRALSKQERLIRPVTLEKTDNMPQQAVAYKEELLPPPIPKFVQSVEQSEQPNPPEPQIIQSTEAKEEKTSPLSTEKEIEKVLIFFKNRTFREYSPD